MKLIRGFAIGLASIMLLSMAAVAGDAPAEPATANAPEPGRLRVAVLSEPPDTDVSLGITITGDVPEDDPSATIPEYSGVATPSALWDVGLVAPGRYTFMHISGLESPWTLHRYICESDEGQRDVDPTFVTIPPGTTVTCTFVVGRDGGESNLVYEGVAAVDLTFEGGDIFEDTACSVSPPVRLELKPDGTSRFVLTWDTFVHTPPSPDGCDPLSFPYNHATFGTWDGERFQVSVLTPRAGSEALVTGAIIDGTAVVEGADLIWADPHQPGKNRGEMGTISFTLSRSDGS